MADGEQLSYAVFGDTHGHYERVAPVIDIYGPSVDRFVFLGDVINGGPDTAKLIRLIRDLGERAITIAGNHEWVCRNALVATQADDIGKHWRKGIWPGLEHEMLESYGLDRSTDWDENAKQLREAMQQTGDLDWLKGLPPYLETDSFVAVHAGPRTSRSWQDQAKALNALDSPAIRPLTEPDQIFSHELALVSDIPLSVDRRTFVSGHVHNLPAAERQGERRVRLATRLYAGDPLLVWLSDSNTIERHYAI